MGYFNGINYPDVFSVETFIVKFFGLTFSVASSICIGKEGVLAHMGSIIGLMIYYVPFFSCFKYFRNNHDKRFMAAGGQAAGVAAAFGSPIGGTLYGYEMTSPAIFWNFEMAWQMFFASCLSTFSLSILDAFKNQDDFSEIGNTGAIKYGSYDENPFTLKDLPAFVVMGVLGGWLGAFFVAGHYHISNLRKRFLTSKAKKVIETTLIVMITATIVFFAPTFLTNECYEIDGAGFTSS